LEENACATLDSGTDTMEPMFEIELDLPIKGSRESSHSLHRQLKAAILDGRLAAGTKLPPTRKAATFFGVSRNTAAEVYERLGSENLVVSRHGSGTYVIDAISPRAAQTAPAGSASPGYALNTFWLRTDVTAAMGFWRDTQEEPAPSARTTTVDFRPALVDSRLFPFDVFRRVIASQLRGLEKKPARYKSPQGNQGNYALRDAITGHIALTRAIVCQADDILISSGAQQAFDLLARVLVTPNRTLVAIEDPGYPPMRAAFAAAGAKIIAIGVDDEGMQVERLPPDVGVICVCPSHQFPLGTTMSSRRRKALVEFARKRGAVIVEDDYDGEFRYEGSSLEALRSSEAADVVFHVGTFSKCMLPALRLGFIIAPRWAMPTLIAAKNCLDWHCSVPIQLGVAAFIREGHLARHVRRMREIYGQRRALILHSLRHDFAEWLLPIPSFYGMHIAAAARTSLDLDRVATTLLQDHVKIHAFSRYFHESPSAAGLVFGYGAVDVAALKRGLASLRKALRT
jgi:GntR family transcriptional regulator/MocR family aminotransferase